MFSRPFSQASERNRGPILEVLRDVLGSSRLVLEIGSGTGQHAVHFAGHLPHLTWQTSDLAENHAGIRRWLDAAALDNVLPPLSLDVCELPWPVDSVDAVFSANTAHIMSWPEVECMFAGVGRILKTGGVFCLYGPFNDHGTYNSESNRAFDRGLRSRDPAMGLRDLGVLQELASDQWLGFETEYSMPTNNRLLLWRKT